MPWPMCRERVSTVTGGEERWWASPSELRLAECGLSQTDELCSSGPERGTWADTELEEVYEYHPGECPKHSQQLCRSSEGTQLLSRNTVVSDRPGQAAGVEFKGSSAPPAGLIPLKGRGCWALRVRGQWAESQAGKPEATDHVLSQSWSQKSRHGQAGRPPRAGDCWGWWGWTLPWAGASAPQPLVSRCLWLLFTHLSLCQSSHRSLGGVCPVSPLCTRTQCCWGGSSLPPRDLLALTICVCDDPVSREAVS